LTYKRDKMDDHALMHKITKEIMCEIIDEVTLSLCFEVHRSAKLGTIFLADTDPESERNHQIVDAVGKDVFGQAPMKKQFECVCPHCQRNMVASRFAPHLEKCMGMGRNSSRVASKRIANSRKSDGSDNEADNDDANDNDWTAGTAAAASRRTKKIKNRAKNGEGRDSPSGSSKTSVSRSNGGGGTVASGSGSSRGNGTNGGGTTGSRAIGSGSKKSRSKQEEETTR